MCCTQFRSLVGMAALWLGIAANGSALAGGSGFNTVVIANQTSSNSCALANYFCERRGVPPENLLRISWSGTNTSWSNSDFQTVLLNPLLEMLGARNLTNQIDCVVLSMDIPYETGPAGSANSTTSGLFYGLKSGTGTDNSYAASEAAFSLARPASAPGYSFLATMLTAESLATVERLVDQGVDSDGTFPKQSVVLAKSSDPVRNIRYLYFDNAAFNVNVGGVSSVLITNSDSPWNSGPVAGYETGLANFAVPAGAFCPGAMADSMTSFGGNIFDPRGQTTALAFINAGASGSYGTVEEPGTDTTKFPNPQAYFYQARGFSLAECYYQSVSVPYLGLILGEPLAAPFARRGSGTLAVASTNSQLAGTIEISASFLAPDASRPIQQLDLFVDGKYFSTPTNLAPCPGNLLTLQLNGYPVTYAVTGNESLSTVAAGLAAALSTSAVTEAAEVTAFVAGDRIELRSLNANPGNNPFYVVNSAGIPGTLAYTVTYLPYPVPPQITILAPEASKSIVLRVDTPDVMPYVVECTTNMAAWLPVFTNMLGGTMTFSDPGSANYPLRLYRVVGLPAVPLPTTAPPLYSVLAGPGESDMVKIDWAGRPYLVLASSNMIDWAPISTNLAPGQYQMTAGSSAETGSALTTQVSLSRPAFLDSAACGLQHYSMPRSTLFSGSWIQFTIVKTNGESISLGVTNQINGTSSTNIAAQLYNLINAAPALAGGDGVAAEDFYINAARTASFSLRARSAGLSASAIEVIPARSGVTIFPSAPSLLRQNLADLQPRNHLYVTAGAARVSLTSALDTTSLADGYHELAAVAYEGSNVRTQTRATLPVIVQNSSLTAALTLLDLTNSVPVAGTYHIRVEANAGNVSAVTLFSTGGALGTLASSPATFTVDGAALGTGLHPFYAIVQSTSGTRYRTQMQWVRFVGGP